MTTPTIHGLTPCAIQQDDGHHVYVLGRLRDRGDRLAFLDANGVTLFTAQKDRVQVLMPADWCARAERDCRRFAAMRN